MYLTCALYLQLGTNQSGMCPEHYNSRVAIVRAASSAHPYSVRVDIYNYFAALAPPQATRGDNQACNKRTASLRYWVAMQMA